MSTNILSPVWVETQRRTVDRTFNAVAIHSPAFCLARKLQRRGLPVTVHPLTGSDSGVTLLNKQLARQGMHGAPLPVLHSTGVIAVDQDKRTEYPGALDPARIGTFWPSGASPSDLHVLLAPPEDDPKLLQTVLASSPANTIVVPQKDSALDFFGQVALLQAAPAVVMSEESFTSRVRQADPLDALADLLDRGVDSSLVVLGRDRIWSAIAGQSRMTLTGVVPTRVRLVQFLVPVTERVGQGQVLNAALVSALHELEGAAVARPVGPLKVVTRAVRTAMNSLWSF